MTPVIGVGRPMAEGHRGPIDMGKQQRQQNGAAGNRCLRGNWNSSGGLLGRGAQKVWVLVISLIPLPEETEQQSHCRGMWEKGRNSRPNLSPVSQVACMVPF